MNNTFVYKKTGNIPLSKEQGNALKKNKDGYYCSSTGIAISQESGNAIVTKDDGIYVKEDSLSELEAGAGIKIDGNEIAIDEESVSETEDIVFSVSDFTEYGTADIVIGDGDEVPGDDDILFEGM